MKMKRHKGINFKDYARIEKAYRMGARIARLMAQNWRKHGPMPRLKLKDKSYKQIMLDYRQSLLDHD